MPKYQVLKNNKVLKEFTNAMDTAIADVFLAGLEPATFGS